MAPLDSTKGVLHTQLQFMEGRMECESPEPHPPQDKGEDNLPLGNILETWGELLKSCQTSFQFSFY